MFDHYVDTAFVGKAVDLLGDGHDAVVDDFVGADELGLLDFCIGTCRGDNPGTEELGNLNRGAANAAAGGKNEHGFARSELGTADEHVPCGLKDERNRGGVGPIKILRIRHAVHIRTAYIFGATAIDHVAKVREIAT